MVGLGIGLSWQFALRSGLSPVLYYEPGQPLQTALLIAVTSLLIGSVAHTVELSNEQTDVGIDALFLEDIF